MWKPKNQILLASVAVLGLVASAQAAETAHPSYKLTANASVATNYVFRGDTQTDEGPAIQGGLDFNHNSGFYAGIWGSNVDFPGAGGTALEYDLNAGFNLKATKELLLDFGYIGYNYTDSTVNDNFGAYELFAGAKFRGFSGYYYNGNAKDSRFDYNYIDLRYTMGLPKEAKLTLHYGHKDYDNFDNVDDASVRVSKEFSGYDAGLTFTTIDGTNNDKDRLVLTVTKYFDL